MNKPPIMTDRAVLPDKRANHDGVLESCIAPRFDFAQVEVYLGKIGVALTQGNWELAHWHVEAAKDELLSPPAVEKPLEVSLVDLLPLRIANGLEEHLDLLFVRDLLEYSPSVIQAQPNIGEKTVGMIAKKLAGIGVVWTEEPELELESNEKNPNQQSSTSNA